MNDWNGLHTPPYPPSQHAACNLVVVTSDESGYGEVGLACFYCGLIWWSGMLVKGYKVTIRDVRAAIEAQYRKEIAA